MQAKNDPSITNKIEDLIINSVRFDADPNIGLSREEVSQRQNEGLVNKTKRRVSKSYGRIIFQSFFSVFNVILYVIAGLMIFAEKYDGLVFLLVLFANIIINLVQDIRARKMTDKMRIESDPHVKVIRDGEEITIDAQDLVLDDIFILESGNTITCDSIIVEGTVNIDESSLSGEADLVKKTVEEKMFSGTYVRSGYVKARVVKVGSANYIETIQEKSREFKRPKTEIFKAINNIFKVIAFFVVLIAALSVVFNLLLDGFSSLDATKETIGKLAGSIVPMIPSGMYLLTSVTLTYGVIRLQKHKTLVQELYSIETLARVDVLCLDKTGTLTDGDLNIEKINTYMKHSEEEVREVVLSLLYATRDNNTTAQAIRKYFDPNRSFVPKLKPKDVIPFDSARKYSYVKFDDDGRYLLGAPEALLKENSRELLRAKKLAKKGYRILALVKLTGTRKKIETSSMELMALIEASDNIREDAPSTLAWFYENNVNSIIISGDNLDYIKSIAEKAGFHDYQYGISLEHMNIEEVKAVALKYRIFARATPEQKEAIIKELQKAGHTVAMVGDGVNDILALKVANCSVAMASGSDAAKNISHLVLTKSNFGALPEIVKEGRRVINNLQRTSSIYLVKTIFAMFFSLTFLLAGTINVGVNPGAAPIVYPFETNSFYLWDLLSIGLASGLLAFEPNYNKLKGTFTKNVVGQAIPSALVMIFAVGLLFLFQIGERGNPGSLFVTEANVITMAGTIMGVMALFVLLKICLPFTKWRGMVFGATSFLVILLLLVFGFLSNGSTPAMFDFNFFRIQFNTLSWTNFFQIMTILFSAVLLLFGGDYIFKQISRKVKAKNASK